MPQIVITERASLDFVRLRNFFMEKSAEATKNASRAIALAIDRLAHNPYLGRKLDSDIRALNVKFGKYGYQIAYCYDEKVYILVMRSGREDSFKDLL